MQTKQLLETNSMVEEFMLLGNISVGERTLQEFPDCALLRRHPAPPPSNYDPIVKAARDRVSKYCVSYTLKAIFPDLVH